MTNRYRGTAGGDPSRPSNFVPDYDQTIVVILTQVPRNARENPALLAEVEGQLSDITARLTLAAEERAPSHVKLRAGKMEVSWSDGPILYNGMYVGSIVPVDEGPYLTVIAETPMTAKGVALSHPGYNPHRSPSGRGDPDAERG